MGITDTEWWFHSTFDFEHDEDKFMDSGFLSDSGAKLLSRNRLMLVAFEDVCWFFINSHLVAKLNLSHNRDIGWISAMGFLFEGDMGPLEFVDFNVWVP